eukprot:TRINITY_DN2828_c0_g1_i1.p1 TRINITY_DN2828_c0_g1~~TRINITY_DN2828_c0_g1_i1.p1  ORF type:complete len:210 (+),score=59.27 TRINITY_DN2828_c0_g1_i1:188-817(+)
MQAEYTSNSGAAAPNSNIVLLGTPPPPSSSSSGGTHSKKKKHRSGKKHSKRSSRKDNSAAAQQSLLPPPAPPQIFVHFPPGTVGLGFHTAHLSQEAVHGIDNKAELEIPVALREREAGPAEPYDLENNVDDMSLGHIEHEVERIADDLRKRKQALLIFLALEIMYSTFLLTGNYSSTPQPSFPNHSLIHSLSNIRTATSSNKHINKRDE